MTYDAIIIGAGPAGAVLAYHLACQGGRVLILEKARLPRYKTCGGGVTLKAVQQLPFDASPAFEVQALGGTVTYAGQFVFKTPVKQPFAWLVMRERFDQYLVEKAVQAGAELVEGAPVRAVEQGAQDVRVLTDQRVYTARLAAGADGANSVVARSLGLLSGRQLGPAIEAEIAVPDAALEEQGPYATFDFGALPHGYGWIFPKKDHLSVGVFTARSGGSVGLKRALQRFIDCQPVLRQGRILQQRGHPVPLGGQAAALHRGRALLVGDAANLADPWLGEGIYSAVLSANLAAEAMSRALSDGRLELSQYSRQINTTLVRQLASARSLASLIYRYPRQASILLGRSRTLQNILFETIRGDRSFRQLNRGLVRHLLTIVLESLQRGKPIP